MNIANKGLLSLKKKLECINYGNALSQNLLT